MVAQWLGSWILVHLCLETQVRSLSSSLFCCFLTFCLFLFSHFLSKFFFCSPVALAILRLQSAPVCRKITPWSAPLLLSASMINYPSRRKKMKPRFKVNSKTIINLPSLPLEPYTKCNRVLQQAGR